jgi:hypothetical protein
MSSIYRLLHSYVTVTGMTRDHRDVSQPITQPIHHFDSREYERVIALVRQS